MSNRFFGSARIKSESLPGYASVNVWEDETGAQTACYNLADTKGEFDIPKRKTKKLSAIWDAIQTAKAEALAGIEAARAYRDARSKGTPGGRFEFAFWCKIGHHCGTISASIDQCLNSTRSHSGILPDEQTLAEIDSLKIPLVDNRTCDEELIYNCTAFPMSPRRPDEFDAAPWHGLSFAPMDVVAWFYWSVGATVRNITPREPAREELTGRALEFYDSIKANPFRK